MDEKRYEQVGTNYRFFLKWRHASFAGYIVILGAIVSFSIAAYKDALPLLWLVPLTGVPFGIFFWIVDIRIQKVFQSAIEAGRKLEGEQGGYFSEQANIGTIPKRDSNYPVVFSHTAALRTIYLAFTLLLIGVSAYFKFWIT